ncbi:MAG: RagB/SusD family nutrient uptake outer membrane protein [Chitinophagaceae bacterium]|nr:RagB/SusD family nutrient uptake outer membrane protein [Chitinophagaceae bacterium]
MKRNSIILIAGLLVVTTLGSCRKFLDKEPLDAPSMGSYWANAEQATLWVNNLYNALGTVEESIYEAYSDNAFGRAGNGANNIANGLYETIDARVAAEWNYRYIRLCLEFFQNIDRVPNLDANTKSQLSGQVRFILAYRYYKLITFFRDVPLVTEPLPVDDADMAKSPKADVLTYILDNLDAAIAELPNTWPAASNGRITKGAALALKARVLLYNDRWTEAAATAKQIMDLNVYRLHPNFEEVFLSTFNNATREVILARQYAPVANTHDLVLRFAPVNMNGNALILPTAELEEAFQMNDGLSKTESPLYTPTNPFANRDPRYYHTFLWHGVNLNGINVDMTGSEYNFAFTYLYFKKYIAEFKDRIRTLHGNWNLFRYAEVLLTYAEAKNEASGPSADVYDAIDSIRVRAGMPVIDRVRYDDQESLRQFIRNERRVELAGEGLRYFDIIRWRIAETVLNKTIRSMDIEQWTGNPLDGNNNPILKIRQVQIRTFNPAKHYVWPVPQTAIDRSNLLTQHSEWQ